MLFIFFTISQNFLMKDMATYAPLPFFAFVTSVLSLELFLILTPPLYKLNKYIPSTNVLGLQYQLSFIGCLMISSCGLYVSFQYFRSTDEYVVNPNRQELSRKHIMSSVGFINTILMCLIFKVCLMQDHPFKHKIHKNKLLFILLLINIFVYSGVMYFN